LRKKHNAKAYKIKLIKLYFTDNKTHK